MDPTSEAAQPTQTTPDLNVSSPEPKPGFFKRVGGVVQKVAAPLGVEVVKPVASVPEGIQRSLEGTNLDPTVQPQNPQVAPEIFSQPQETYSQRVYRQVKERYPNLIISGSFNKDKTPILTGGENGLGGDKMEILNYGEKVSADWAAKTGHEREERAVAFKLREGSQKDRLAFMLDPKNPDRVISPADATSVDLANLPNDQFSSALVFHKEGDKLFATEASGKETEIVKQMLETGSYIFSLDPMKGLAVELVGWGSGSSGEDDIIVLHKTQVAPSTPKPVAPEARKKIIDLLGPGILATGVLANLGGDPTPVVEVVQPPEEHAATVAPLEKPFPEAPQSKVEKVDDSLKCEKFEQKTVEEGDSLTKLLVDVNGIDRYFKKGDDGLFSWDVNLLYKDLMLMIYQPENMAQLQKDDPEAASLITAVMDMQKATGHVTTSQELYDTFKDKLNTPQRVEKAHDQLVLTFAGSVYQVPVCETSIPVSKPLGTKDNPIPPSSGNAGLASAGPTPQPFNTVKP